ncbi:hypothetical protein QYF61_022687 [Mycteria americana]|uniref:Uncharacterized protein n=1 Tax=Mycteria americana TaxID=33587 RepID=A0AAN7NL62_MYCAM|nr:hypothetical protein QYF61_022687 [Mycteria americana]
MAGLGLQEARVPWRGAVGAVVRVLGRGVPPDTSPVMLSGSMVVSCPWRWKALQSDESTVWEHEGQQSSNYLERLDVKSVVLDRVHPRCKKARLAQSGEEEPEGQSNSSLEILQDERTKHFSIVADSKMKDNGHKLQVRIFGLIIKKNLLNMKVSQPWNWPREWGGPKLNTVFEVRPHQCRVQGHDHFPTPAGHAIFDTSQDAIGFLGHLGTLLAHIQAAVNQHAQVLFCLAAFQPLFSKPVALHGVVVAQVQDPALSLVKPHTIDLDPSIQPVQVPLQSLPTLKHINTPGQLGVICKLTEGALDPFIQIIDKDIKQNWPQHRALGNTTCDHPPTGVNSIHHHSLGPAIQPVLYPAKSTPIQAMSSQFLQENSVGNRVKGFTEV